MARESLLFIKACRLIIEDQCIIHLIILLNYYYTTKNDDKKITLVNTRYCRYCEWSFPAREEIAPMSEFRALF